MYSQLCVNNYYFVVASMISNKIETREINTPLIKLVPFVFAGDSTKQWA